MVSTPWEAPVRLHTLVNRPCEPADRPTTSQPTARPTESDHEPGHPSPTTSPTTTAAVERGKLYGAQRLPMIPMTGGAFCSTTLTRKPPPARFSDAFLTMLGTSSGRTAS